MITNSRGIKDYLQWGIITGPEYLSIVKYGAVPISIEGIENENLYTVNYKAYRDVMFKKSETDMFFENIAVTLQLLKENIFSETLYECDFKEQSFDAGKIGLKEYTEYLFQSARILGLLDAEKYGQFTLYCDIIDAYTGFDFEKLEKERMQFINTLGQILSKDAMEELVRQSLAFRLGKISGPSYYVFLRDVVPAQKQIEFEKIFPVLFQYFLVAQKEKSLDHTGLFKDIISLRIILKERLVKSSEERKLLDIVRRIGVLQRLFGLTLNREDMEEYSKEKERYAVLGLISEITALADKNGISVSLARLDTERSAALDAVRDEAEQFYKAALKRDVVLVENTLQKLSKSGKSRAIMISGGFHSDGILRLLREKGISYLVISPVVEKSPDPAMYEQVMMGQNISFLPPLSCFSEALSNATQSMGLKEELFERLVLELGRVRKIEDIEPAVEAWAEQVPEESRALFNLLKYSVLKVAQVTIFGFQQDVVLALIRDGDQTTAKILISYLVSSGNARLLTERFVSRIPRYAVREYALQALEKAGIKFKMSDVSTPIIYPHVFKNPTMRFDEARQLVHELRSWSRTVAAQDPNLKDWLESLLKNRGFIEMLLGYRADPVTMPRPPTADMQRTNAIFTRLFLELQVRTGGALVYAAIEEAAKDNACIIRPVKLSDYDLPDSERAGLIDEAGAPLAKEIPYKSAFEGTVKNISVITRNRPAELRTSLDEFLHNLCEEFEHVPMGTPDEAPVLALTVLDDSDPVFEAQNAEVIRAIQKKYKAYRIRIGHFGMYEKELFKSGMTKRMEKIVDPADHEKLHGAITLMLKPSEAGNRNWAALLTGRDPYIMLDDDVHPRTSFGPGDRVPIDFLSIMNRALSDDSFTAAAFSFAVHKDDRAYEIFRAYLKLSPEDQQGQIPLFPPEQMYGSEEGQVLYELEERRGRTQGGVLGVAGSDQDDWFMRRVPALPMVASNLRITDMSIGMMQNLLSGDWQNRKTILSLGGAVDHTRSPTGRENIAKTILLEEIGGRLLGNILYSRVARLYQVIDEKTSSSDIVESIGMSIEDSRYLEFLTLNEDVLLVLTRLFSVYRSVLSQKNTLPEASTIQSDFETVFEDMLGLDVSDPDVFTVLKEVTESAEERDVKYVLGRIHPEQQLLLDAAAKKMASLLRKEIEGYGAILSYWPLAVQSADEELGPKPAVQDSAYSKAETAPDPRAAASAFADTEYIDEPERERERFIATAFDSYHPVSEVFAYLNYVYYSLRGSDIFTEKDFPTLVAWNNETAYANAEEFYRRVSDLDKAGKLPERLVIREWGIGNGRYAADFLDRMRKLDEEKGTAYYDRIQYIMGDISEKMVMDARRQYHLLNHQGVMRFEVLDATDLSSLERGTTMLVRFNELYDDLPGNDLIYKDGDNYYLLTARMTLAPDFRAIRKSDGADISADEFMTRYWPRGISGLSELAPAFIQGVTWEERRVPIAIDDFAYGPFIRQWASGVNKGLFPVNRGAILNLVQAVSLLHAEGYIQFYDYGFIDDRYITQVKDGEKVSRPAGQPTVYVNLSLLRHVAEELLGCEATVETQSEYLSRARGERVIGRELGYLAQSSPGLLPGIDDLKQAEKAREFIGDRRWKFEELVTALYHEGVIGEPVRNFFRQEFTRIKFYQEGVVTGRAESEAALKDLIEKTILWEFAKLTYSYENVWVTKRDLRQNKTLQTLGVKTEAIQRMVDGIFALPYDPVRTYFHMRVVPPASIGYMRLLLDSNALLANRGRKKVSEVVDAVRIDEIAAEYAAYLDKLVETAKAAGKKSLAIRVLYHNDADGVAAARMVGEFLRTYGRHTGIQFDCVYESKSIAAETIDAIQVDRTGIDAVFAVDLYWAQAVAGIDMAIDHHWIEEDQKAFAANKKLVNLQEVGFTGTESKYLPASLLSAILFDYILKKKGIAEGLRENPGEVPMSAIIDGAILGDMYYDEKTPPQEGFLVRDRQSAQIIWLLAECGQTGLDIVLNVRTPDKLREVYDQIRTVIDQRLVMLASRLQRDEFNSDGDVIGIFLSEEDRFLQLNGFRLDLTRPIITAFCEHEKMRSPEELASERRIVVVAAAPKERDVLTISVRFDGDKSLFNLKNVLDDLRKADAGRYGEGGGHPGAISIRIPRGDIGPEQVDRLEALTKELITQMRTVVSQLKRGMSDPLTGSFGYNPQAETVERLMEGPMFSPEDTEMPEVSPERYGSVDRAA
ncbi:hypothetical protein LDC_0194 [sediment metagenome]|uniref:Uncharacterized protein n=1 Tax=sediment metagenome TaxID=749907 RepID=D9PFB5_9ZZZZ